MANKLTAFVRNHFQIDRVEEIDWDLVRNNLRSAEHVLSNLDKFPRADRAYLNEQADELALLLLAHS